MEDQLEHLKRVALANSTILLHYSKGLSNSPNVLEKKNSQTEIISMDDLTPPKILKKSNTLNENSFMNVQSNKPKKDNSYNSNVLVKSSIDKDYSTSSAPISAYNEDHFFQNVNKVSEPVPTNDQQYTHSQGSEKENTKNFSPFIINRSNNWHTNKHSSDSTTHIQNVASENVHSEPSPDTLSHTRTRQSTVDSLGFVKYTPAAGKFEDLKNEAINSWEEGLDLELETASKEKKRSEWLPQSAFFAEDTYSAKPEQLDVSFQNVPQEVKKSYSDVASGTTPNWAIDDNNTSAWNPDENINSVAFGFNQQPTNVWRPTMLPSQSMQHMTPVIMMPSSYIPMANNYSPQDKEFLIYFYSVISKPNIRSVINGFQKKVETILNRNLHEMSLRTFELLLKSLILVMDYESNHLKFETARKIHDAWSTFIYYLTRYVQSYVQLPDDLYVVLKFIVLMSRYYPNIKNDLPLSDISQIYESLQKVIDVEKHSDLIKYLRLTEVLPEENSDDSFYHELHDYLPSIPIAEVIVSEEIENINMLQLCESKREITIANKVHNPWPNLDLRNYILNHFVMLRDELVSPLQRVVRELFKGIPPTKFQIPECAVYEQTIPKSVTLSMSSSEPCIVFQLGKIQKNDEIMGHFKEGSLVLLLPENECTQNPTSVIKRIAETAILGHAIYAITNHSRTSASVIRMVSIHVHKEDLSKIDWDAKYSIITSNINATSVFSLLKWLRSEYINLDKKHFSQVITPRILASKNVLTQSQLSSWNAEYYDRVVTTNEDAIPDYLADSEIDISCIMAKNGNHCVRLSEGNWPCYSAQWQQVAPSKRPPLYSLSPSQVNAIQFALTHRIAVISGASGTGKTFLASKLVQLMSKALTSGQFHQPILIITKNQFTLDDILSKIVNQIPDIVRFGREPLIESLASKQATRLAIPNTTDSNYRQYQKLEHQLSKNQSKLNTLFKARFQALEHDPAVLLGAIAPAYLSALEKGYTDNNQQEHFSNRILKIWCAWASNDKRTKNYATMFNEYKANTHAQWCLENAYLQKGGRGLLPLLSSNIIRNRFTSIANNNTPILSIADSKNWPFENSEATGSSLRCALLDVWRAVPPEKIWLISDEAKTTLINNLSKVLIDYIDKEIEILLQKQVKLAQSIDEIIVQKCSFLCRFNRAIGMTADFAAAHRDWVSTLWPRAVIVDEASDILESTVASSILGSRTEHVILLGTNGKFSKPRIINPTLAGNPRNLDVSLFERWKNSTSEMVLLEEQWRMHSKVASIVDKFNSTKEENSSLLITAHLASCNENMVDGRYSKLEPLYGISQRSFYLNYEPPTADHTIDTHYSKLLTTAVTNTEVDEARYVAFFAVYLSQQPYNNASITILTTCLLQKYLIRHILRDEAPKRTCFKSNIAKIKLDIIEKYMGREDNFVIISTATPGHSSSPYNLVYNALTRARYGLFVIGKPGVDRVHPRWNDFANYMKDCHLYGSSIQLTCHTHGDTIFAGRWEDFDKVKNGGCQRPCATLMSDGHACKEECHFMDHSEVICYEPCNRLRPSKCKHACPKKCFECSQNGSCPPCMIETKVKLSCGHSYVGVCHTIQNIEQIKCQELVSVTFGCGHETMVECYKSRSQKIRCEVTKNTILKCGHEAVVKCGDQPLCLENCNQLLECGHKCPNLCNAIHNHSRDNCIANCPKQLICGHRCAKGCANPNEHTERCMERCNYVCSHGYKCGRECWRDCIRCVSECPYKCDHYKCTRKCYKICDRPPCYQPCRKRLSCSHQCAGLCGEPCPPCVICSGDLKCSISLRTLSEFDKDEKAYMLPECGCVFSVEALDKYFETQSMNGQHTAIKLWECPTCQKAIYTALRYNKYIKTEITLVNTIKLRLEQERQKLSYHEKAQIINAMNDETRQQAAHNIVGGRWFVCPNQHPYYVGDCGGATEISKCPECDALIGGTQHKVVGSNRFYGEFDGSEKPAWPGQPN
ncbi:uncharacterized protein BX663DRAFT_547290 [Cokeromyces recurvatus]|uniref:uncharacterized protein n=1 Tax=Cokeromyces recurvatus TaxID=90255 RepID=UPI00221FFA3D|nr:uncharacterized protein BX663DRAFT_547290 [Cokeromyces recurvatus]KAI7907579.1 hypothetical protein BX663DRAFT_547290 [Cokeromyces recurvatus]